MGFVSSLQDAHLVSRALAHDSAAFAELVRRHMPGVSAVAMAYTKNRSDAEDVAQEAFLKAWQSLDTLRTPRRFGGWVVTIARNVARSYLNRKRREAEKLDQYETEAVMANNGSGTGPRDAMGQLLPDLVAALPESERELVLLHYQEGMKSREIATLLDITNVAVRKRLERIRRKLGHAILASLAHDADEKERRERRSSQIASAVVAIPPAWKPVALGIVGAGVLGLPVTSKVIGVGVVVLALTTATYIGLHRTTRARDDGQSANPDTVRAADTTPAAEPPANREPVGEEVLAKLLSSSRVADGASIAGRVVEEESGDGASDARIRLHSKVLGEDVEIRSDDTGFYSFEGLAPGDYWVEMNWDPDLAWRYPRNVYDPQERKLSLKQDESMTNVDFVVVRGLTARGVLAGPDGTPLAEALLRAWSQDKMVETETRTDAEGRFELHGFGTDKPAFFWAQYEGLAMAPYGPVTVPAEGLENLAIAMYPESTIAGRLVDQNGVPQSGVRVWPRPGNLSRVPKIMSGTTEEGGNFELRGLHQADYGFSIRFPGDSNSRQLRDMDDISLAAGEHLRDLKLVYVKPGSLTITGRVTDDVGIPREGMHIRAEGANEYTTAETDAQGNYELKGLAPGLYEVNVNDVTFAGTSQWRVEAEAGDRGVDLVVPRNGTVRGTVVDAETGGPISKFEVLCPGTVLRWTEFRDEGGRFEIRSLRPDEWTLGARAEGYAMGVSEPFVLSPGGTFENVVIHLDKAGSVSGFVIDPAGEPVRDVDVKIDDGATHTDTRTDAEGQFTNRDVRPGEWTLVARHPGYAPIEMPVTVRVGQESRVEVQLQQGATLHGTVTRDGKPLEGVRIELVQSTRLNRFGYSGETTSDSEGNYDFTGIPAGGATLHLNPMFGSQGRVIDVWVKFDGTEEKVVDVGVDDGTATAAFDIAMEDSLIARDGRIHIGLEYHFGGGQIERFYTFVPSGPQVQLEGVHSGKATLTARYYAAGMSEVLSEVEPVDVVIQDGVENHFPLVFREKEPLP